MRLTPRMITHETSTAPASAATRPVNIPAWAMSADALICCDASPALSRLKVTSALIAAMSRSDAGSTCVRRNAIASVRFCSAANRHTSWNAGT